MDGFVYSILEKDKKNYFHSVIAAFKPKLFSK